MPPRRRTLASSFLFLLLLLMAIASFGDKAELDTRGAERSALLRFKGHVSADPAGLLRRWGPGPDHCSWPGVGCDGRSRVVSLNISAKGGGFLLPCSRSGPFRRSCSDPRRRLAGTLSSAVGNLSELRVLSLPFHGFDGVIPGEVWGLEHLEVLDLESSSFSGSLPSLFPRKLRVLNLGSNLLGGEIPPSLSRCVELETLDLSGNQINGTIPGFLNGFSKLRELYLSFNRLGGSIPEEIGYGCRTLQILDLSGNLLVESIPTKLGDCANLRVLVLSSNLLDGSIPSELGRLSKLEVLDVSRNRLSGFVPAELGNCLELFVLVLLNLHDPMSDDEASNSVDKDEFNYFRGKLAENITALPKLRVLWAPRATFEGEIPGNWGSCESLETVNLGDNRFTGMIPKVFGQCRNLRFLNLSSNNLVGCLDKELPVPCMDVFDVSGNQLSASIPTSTHKRCPSSRIPVDHLSSSYSSFFACKSRSGLSLPFPETAGEIFIYHNFGRNNFTGTLPSLPLDNHRHANQTVYAFLANGNHISGSLSAFALEMCDKVKHLIIDIGDNMISGGFTSEVGAKCRSLVVLKVASNQISETIPASIGLLENLVSLDLSRNWLQGEIPASIKQLRSLKYLSLAGNNLSGHVPSGLGQLQSLKVLDLSSNSLTGYIPSDLVKMENLTTLLLNNNNLSGIIPSAFAKVASLSRFNVSFNSLSGPLPFNASTLRCDSLHGNPFLQSCHVYALSVPSSDLLGSSQSSQPNTDSSDDSSSGGFSSVEIAAIASAAAIVAVVLALIVLYIYARKCTPRPPIGASGRKEVTVFVDIGVPLTYESVVQATGGFNASNCIGSGGFGATYKAEISPGVLVAIKRLAVGRFQGVQQFHAEIKTLGGWRHPNLVTLIGYHVSDSEMFLIYNYLPGGRIIRIPPLSSAGRQKSNFIWRLSLRNAAADAEPINSVLRGTSV
ncbi:LRR receptor-like serine threonine-protein kinase [Musa troglodytarum]|uniref:non-specific serine/threonine protein kinase n=1 Tax=Musa troglodytarum TaxID=320322 RepID=A0A9E7JY95_9LILI|nr:LRR receptor-like serine threonine-protein kinase [Musa troglodytarum]